MDRAYSVFEVKALDSEQRVIEGIASTPTPDRGGDIMVPEGAQFALPLPFLWFHDKQSPIGEVFAADVRPEGIYIKARVSKVTEPGRLKSLTDEAWAAFTAKPPLVRGLSIGWKPKDEDGAVEAVKGTQFVRFWKWIWGELSAVTIPMNAEATILSVKAFDRAASTNTSPAPVTRSEARAMTNQELITGLENKRAASYAAAMDIQNKAAGEGRSKDDTEREQFDTLMAEVRGCDRELADAREMEKLAAKAATPITAATNTTAASDLRGGKVAQVTITPQLPKGTAFVRAAMALTGAKGDSYAALERAKSWTDTPEVEALVRFSLNQKAAVAAASTTAAGWASNLAIQQPTNEFLELLRPRTLIGRIPGFRQVPFNISVPAQTGGGTYSWVGEGNAKPVTSGTLATVTVGYAKAAGIIVLTRELVMISSPSAEGVVREEMVAGISAFLDTQLVDPTVAAVAGVNPASITNGAATAAASGATAAALRTDLAARVATFTAANIPLDGAVWLMNDSNAFAAGISLNALGQPLFPGVGQQGGSILGIPVIVSNNVGNRIVLVHAPSILFADEGGVSLDVSQEASVQMDSAPSNPSDATTVLVSFWQRNLVGLRAERMINWTRARTAAVTYISAAAYTGA